MSNYRVDPIVEAFVINYGVVALLEDIGVTHMQSSPTGVITNCVFHDDNSPSLGVDTSNGVFNCFSCSARGNLYKLVQMAYNLTFKEAREFILARSGLGEGVNIDSITRIRDIENIILSLNSQNKEFVMPKVSQETISRMYEGPDPHNYLLGRGYSQKAIDYLECGYTTDYLGKGYGKKQERITIPGHDENGNICGFIGRTPIDQMPKYLYTSGYPKSHTLFNLHRAKKHSDAGLILVEGSLDALRIHDLGYPNVCAILGASLSAYQLKLLKRYTDKIFLMFDTDAAGNQANLKALEMTHNELNVNLITMKNFKDPGEITIKETLDELLFNAKNWRIYNLHKKAKYYNRQK